MRTKDSVGERIRKLRGMNTQTEFANLLGITQRAVVNYETQGRIPRGSILKKICSCFGVSEKWLLTGSDEVNNPTQQEVAGCSKMGDMSPISKQEKRQPADFIVSEKNNLGDTSPILDLQQRLLDALQEQNNLLRENAHLRLQLERRDMRIRDLEREVAELREARKGPSAYGAGVAGSAG